MDPMLVSGTREALDQAVGLGIGWPEIAARLGVTRQAAVSTTSAAIVAA